MPYLYVRKPHPARRTSGENRGMVVMPPEHFNDLHQYMNYLKSILILKNPVLLKNILMADDLFIFQILFYHGTHWSVVLSYNPCL